MTRAHRDSLRTLDPCSSPPLSFASLLSRSCARESFHGNANLSTTQPQAEEQARVPRADEHPRRAEDLEPPPPEGSQAVGRRDRKEVTADRAAAPEGQRKRQAFPRSRRIARGSEIREILLRGKRSRTPHLDVFGSTSPREHSRAGVIVPRYGRRVVDRNRVKRRLREILRREVLPRLSGMGLTVDVLVRARREAYGVSYVQLREELLEWVNKRRSQGSSSS